MKHAERSWWVCENCLFTICHAKPRSRCIKCGWWMHHAMPQQAREAKLDRQHHLACFNRLKRNLKARRKLGGYDQGDQGK